MAMKTPGPGDEPSEWIPDATRVQALLLELNNCNVLLGMLTAQLEESGAAPDTLVQGIFLDEDGNDVPTGREQLLWRIKAIKAELATLKAGPYASTKLRPLKDVQMDFFIADILDPAVKDDMASMEHPIFSLSKKPDTAIRRYVRNGNTLEIFPSTLGLATIWDKDIIIYCASQLIAGINNGSAVSRTIRVVAYDLLKATNRGVSGAEYDRLKEALDRLSGTRLKTNILTGGQRQIENFGLIDGYGIIERSPVDNRMVSVQITLSEWFYNAIKAKEVLTLHKDYFRVSSSIERRIYELVRKHCGRQTQWVIGIESLHQKTGSQAPLKRFRHEMKKLAGGTYRMLGYVLWYQEDADSMVAVADTPDGLLRLANLVGNRIGSQKHVPSPPVLDGG